MEIEELDTCSWSFGGGDGDAAGLNAGKGKPAKIRQVEQSRIRNFSIVAQSTTASRRSPTASCSSRGAVAERDMREQMLDSMDLERERGITIKAQAVRVPGRTRASSTNST